MGRFQHTGQPDWDWWGKLWPTPGATLRHLGITSETTLAEVACGNGYFTLPAARITAPNPVYALDLDESLLGELVQLADEQHIENIVPLHGDARELAQLVPEPVDVLLIANTFHGIDEAADIVQQAFDSLRPGGRLVIINWRDIPREHTTVDGLPRGPPTAVRLSPEETAAVVLDAAEFTRTESIDVPPYHYALVFER